MIGITGCKTTSPPNTFTAKTLPETFSAAKDSANAANINWKEYFADANLQSLIDEALKNNLDLLIALQRIEAARSEVKLTHGLLLPTVGLSGAYWQRKFGDYTMDWAGNKTTEITPGQIVPKHLPDYFIGLQTSWEIDIWGKLRTKKKAAVSRYLSTLEGRNLAVTNLIAEIATYYYELVALDNELDIMKATIKLQEDALTIVKVQKETRVSNELAVQQFEAQLLNSKSMETEILQKIIETESGLNMLLGRYPQSIIRDKLILSQLLPIQLKVGIPSDLLKNRPDIRQSEFELMATKADVKAAKLAFYPSLTITGTLGYQAFNTAYLLSPESMAYNLLGNLTTPLINRNAIKAGFNAANANQTSALYNYQKSIINGYVEVYNQMANIKNLQQMQEFRKKEVDVLNRSIETSSELFRTGRASYLEILMTQKNALQAKIELVNTQKRQYNAVINIYKALGGGWR
jgi:multidrug efflux system outer membrane protein